MAKSDVVRLTNLQLHTTGTPGYPTFRMAFSLDPGKGTPRDIELENVDLDSLMTLRTGIDRFLVENMEADDLSAGIILAPAVRHKILEMQQRMAGGGTPQQTPEELAYELLNQELQTRLGVAL